MCSGRRLSSDVPITSCCSRAQFFFAMVFLAKKTSLNVFFLIPALLHPFHRRTQSLCVWVCTCVRQGEREASKGVKLQQQQQQQLGGWGEGGGISLFSHHMHCNPLLPSLPPSSYRVCAWLVPSSSSSSSPHSHGTNPPPALGRVEGGVEGEEEEEEGAE